jgi:hypothetical protein
MSAASGVLRLLGVPLNLELLLGSALVPKTGPEVWLIGLGLHLALGGCFGVAYALVFEKSLREANVGIGFAIGAVHAVVSGTVLAFTPDFHPLIPELLWAPGPFLLGLGAWGVLLFLALHLMFGAIVAAWYGPVSEPRQLVLGRRRRMTTH